MLRKTITLIGSALLLSACASSIPTTTKMSDAIMMGIKTSPAKAVGYEYKSNIQDGVIKPCNKDTRDVQGSHPGYMHTESTTLDKMIRDYMSMKFSSMDSVSDPKIKVTLKDFWLEQYSTDSKGRQWLVALGGGELNIMVVANLDLVYEISKGGASVTKAVRVSGDSAHAAGIGTGTSTSNIYRGNQSIEFRVADAMNAANNKAIAMLNQFIESNQP
ncbi:MAG: hypothetical protein V1685_02600 [Parcubacteria group bacterium]